MLQILLKCSLLIIALSFNFVSANTGTRGGGDICENRIKIIRDDIKDWLNMGGADTLKLPPDLSVAEYKDLMLQQIQKAKIKCVGLGDQSFPVEIDGTPKVCRFDLSEDESVISCDFEKFQSMNESNQYVLVHHELAGLAQIELPNGADSYYAISNQLVSFLADVVIKKLVVRNEQKKSYDCSLNEERLAKVANEGGTYLYNLVSQDLINKGIKLAIDPKANIKFDRQGSEGRYSFLFINEVLFETASGALLSMKIAGYSIIRTGEYDNEGNLKSCIVKMPYNAFILSVENLNTGHSILNYGNKKKIGGEVIAHYWNDLLIF